MTARMPAPLRALPPRFRRWATQWPWFALGLIGLGSALGYKLATHWFLRSPYAVTPTALDRMLPYMAWTVPLYLTYFATLPIFVAVNVKRPAIGVMLRRATTYVGLNIAATIVFPTQIVPWEVLAHDDWGARLLRSIDGPYAVMPSGHVGLPCCLALLAHNFGGRGAGWFAAWTALIGVTVLTTKQHYAWDVLAGLLLGLAVAAWPNTGQTELGSTVRSPF